MIALYIEVLADFHSVPEALADFAKRLAALHSLQLA